MTWFVVKFTKDVDYYTYRRESLVDANYPEDAVNKILDDFEKDDRTGYALQSCKPIRSP